jgi:predicted Zn-dependent protease
MARRLAPLLPALLLSACATDAVTGRKTLNYYSLADEVKMGQQTLALNTKEMQTAGVPINRDRQRVEQIEAMVKKISAASDLPQLPYNVTLYETNIVNAAAAPGGSMMVFAGLYDPKIGLVKEENELAAVIGHEIAHVTCRHTTERLSRVVPVAVLIEIGAQVLSHRDQPEIAWALRGAFAVGTALLIPAYSRSDEREADRVGMRYMARAGYDPRASLQIWKRVAEKEGRKASTSIFATHPSDWDRYKALEKELPAAMEEYRKATGRYPEGYSPP